jgi:hypothetical protein
VHAHLDQVVPRLRLDLGGVLGRLLGRRDVVDADLDARVLGEALADLGELLVGRGGEVVPGQVGNLALLGPGGRDPRGQDSGKAGGSGQEVTTADIFHALLLEYGTGRSVPWLQAARDRRHPPAWSTRQSKGCS